MSPPSSPAPAVQATSTFDLLAGGTAAFARLLGLIGRARRRIVVRSFEWRDDDAGQAMARALLAAAERGVEVTILKDRLGGFYEHLQATKQSFFHKRIEFGARWQLWGLMMFYGRWGSLRQTPSALAEALRAHPRVRCVVGKRFDHAKVYTFDDETVVLGGMGIGNDYRDVNLDFMVEISGGDAVERLAERSAGGAPFDEARTFDYLLPSFEGRTRLGPSLAEERLALIAGARERLTIAMAYLGDRAATEALAAAVRRGVSVTLLTAARSDVSGDLNLFTCAQLLRRARGAENLRILLHPTMVHGKAIVGDGSWVDIGSTNFTRLSHHGYDELNVFVRDAGFARAVEASIERDAVAATRARLPLDYRLWRTGFEALVTAFQTSRPRARR
jgi:cardiolipin synthase A/B